MIAAMAAGALLLLGPAVLKTRFGVDEVVTTLLLNFIVLLFVSMLLEGPLKDPMGLGWPQSQKVDRRGAAAAHHPAASGCTTASSSAIVAGVVVWVVMKTHGARLRDARRRPQPAGRAPSPASRSTASS